MRSFYKHYFHSWDCDLTETWEIFYYVEGKGCFGVFVNLFVPNPKWLFSVSNTGIKEQLPQRRAWMTDEELICNLVKRFSLNVFRLVGNFPSGEQKHCEVAGFSCCHSSEEPVASLGGGVTCIVNTALCSCVTKALSQQLPSSSFPPGWPRHKHARLSASAPGFIDFKLVNKLVYFIFYFLYYNWSETKRI